MHLRADLNAVIRWADHSAVRWAVSDGNAGSYGASFYTGAGALSQVNWQAVATNSWSDPAVKEGKQAEFLMWDAFPWTLIEHVGVINAHAASQALAAMQGGAHIPPVTVEHSWYY